MGEWSLKPEKVGTMVPGVGSGVGEADGGSKKWEGTLALTQSILQAILNVSPLSPLAQGVTGIPFTGEKNYKAKTFLIIFPFGKNTHLLISDHFSSYFPKNYQCTSFTRIKAHLNFTTVA